MAGIDGCVLATFVAYVGAAVMDGVGVEDFFVEAGAGDADDVAFSDDRSGVHNYYDKVVFGFTFAKK